jgi:hypothetical protein
MTNWKVGDWVTYEMRVGQIKEINSAGNAIFSDGTFQTSGRLQDLFRPLTLRNKSIVETFDNIYNRLREIDGEAGFNYHDIHSHFSALALSAIDHADSKPYIAEATQFVVDAREYKGLIQGVHLFRPNLRAKN